jgi:hypothetical protein
VSDDAGGQSRYGLQVFFIYKDSFHNLAFFKAKQKIVMKRSKFLGWRTTKANFKDYLFYFFPPSLIFFFFNIHFRYMTTNCIYWIGAQKAYSHVHNNHMYLLMMIHLYFLWRKIYIKIYDKKSILRKPLYKNQSFCIIYRSKFIYQNLSIKDWNQKSFFQKLVYII